MNIPLVRRGVSSADDAFLAYAAKSVAEGRGYGAPLSPDKFVLFDHAISTGPTLILPIAFLIRVFGTVDQLPGGATLAIFIGQLIVTAIILSRRFGWAPTCGFLAAVLWLVMIASKNFWYFGTLLGEPVTFGFILLGAAVLAVAKRDREIAAGALCLSLALLTKQIALFAVTGIVASWFLVSAFDRPGFKVLFRWAAILLGVILSLPIAFEAVKLITLGPAAYSDYSKLVYDVSVQQGVGSGDLASRWNTFHTLLFQSYISAPLVASLAIGSVLFLVPLWRGKDEQRRSVWRLAAFTWAGAAGHFVYVLMFSVLWARYFFVGIAVMIAAICVPLLGMGSRLRIAVLVILLAGTFWFGFHEPLYGLRQWVSASTEPAERAEVVKWLDSNPDVPYVAHHWTSLFDVLYLQKKEGRWLYEPGVKSLRDRDFIAVINNTFTDKNGPFFKSVVATCEPLTPEAKRILAYRCSKQFWSSR